MLDGKSTRKKNNTLTNYGRVYYVYNLMRYRQINWNKLQGPRVVVLTALLLLCVGCGSTSLREKQHRSGHIANRDAMWKSKEQRFCPRQPDPALANLRSEAERYITVSSSPPIDTHNQDITTSHPQAIPTVPSPPELTGPPLSPQELLDRQLNNPCVVLTPDQSISLVNHCAGLGEQRSAVAQNKEVCLVLGNTGSGKSTFLNYLMGCTMKSVQPGALGLPGVRRVITVDPDSAIPEVMPIGHGAESATFLPQIELDPNNRSNAYCDCPSFNDTRGSAINIANSINIKKILRQVSSVKALFLTSYADISTGRGRGIAAMKDLCQQMFGSVENLRRYQNSVLLGITQAPVYDADGDPITRDMIRFYLGAAADEAAVDTDIAHILANRFFLFDPLDRGTYNPDFWSLAQCRNEIAQLGTIPHSEASTLFQTALTDRDQTHLLDITRQIRDQITRAIEQEDAATLGRYWQLLQRLQVMQHNEVGELLREVLPTINSAIQQLINAFREDAAVQNFDAAQQQLNRITEFINNLPGTTRAVDTAGLHEHLERCRENADDQEALQ